MSLLPKSRPKIGRPDVEKIVRYFFGKDWKLEIVEVAIRGYYANTFGKPGVNDINFYDDALAVIIGEKYKTFNWNTDPSRFIEKGRPKAILRKGVHWYELYYHKIGDPKKRYVALRPATPNAELPAWRRGRDGKLVESIGRALNQHKGGTTDTWSEGCQTTHFSQFDEFISMIGNALGYKVPLGIVPKKDPRLPLGRIPYILIEKADMDYILGLDEARFGDDADSAYRTANFVCLPVPAEA